MGHHFETAHSSGVIAEKKAFFKLPLWQITQIAGFPNDPCTFSGILRFPHKLPE